MTVDQFVEAQRLAQEWLTAKASVQPSAVQTRMDLRADVPDIPEMERRLTPFLANFDR